MKKKFLSRTLALVLIGVLIWFATLLERSPSYYQDDGEGDGLSSEQGSGTKVTYQAFDRNGNRIQYIRADDVQQTDAENLRLKGRVTARVLTEKTPVTLIADRIDLDPDGVRIMIAEPGAKITLETDDGFVMETIGPLSATKGHVFTTDAVATFRMGDARGHCRGLRYQPGVVLELKRDAVFASLSQDEEVQIEADNLKFNLKNQTGLVRQAVITSESKQGNRLTMLDTGNVSLNYLGGFGEPFKLLTATLEGNPASIIWDDKGGLTSSTFDICFDQAGKQAETILTEDDASFFSQAEDGSEVHGTSGRLTLTLKDSQPQKLIGSGKVLVKRSKTGTKPMFLNGTEGLETGFQNGSAYSTRIYGSTTFEYESQFGGAGVLRALHGERKLLFSERAELRDETRHIQVKGDEILLANWDQEEKEIFASGFVEMVKDEGTPEMIRGWGDQLTFKVPNYFVSLRGGEDSSARFEREGSKLLAGVVELRQRDDGLYEMSAVNKIDLNLQLADGMLTLLGESMNFSQSSNILKVGDVKRLHLPGQGEMSCEDLELGLRPNRREDPVDYFKALGNVIFQGSFLRDGEQQTFSCQADVIESKPGAEDISFLGTERDVIIHVGTTEHRGRQLTYSPRDGSILAGSGPNGERIKTIIPLSDFKNE